MSNGKGSQRRPMQVSRETFARNWERIFAPSTDGAWEVFLREAHRRDMDRLRRGAARQMLGHPNGTDEDT
jgi:hypothetical protein